MSTLDILQRYETLSNMTAASYKLHYWPLRGRAEFIRYIFAHAGVAYEEAFYDRKEWPTHKPTTPMGQLPFLEVNGTRIAQSKAIGRYLAREFGLAGKDNLEQARVDMLVDGCYDTFGKYVVIIRAKIQGDEAKAKEEWNKFRDKSLIPHFKLYSKLLKENETGSGWFVGKTPTWADFYIGEFHERLETLFEADVTKDFPDLRAHYKKVGQLSGIAKRIASRPQMPF